MNELQLIEIFENNFDCYANAVGVKGVSIEMAMSEEKFVSVVLKLLKHEYNQGILDLLDKSDGLDINFQANKLFKNENDGNFH